MFVHMRTFSVLLVCMVLCTESVPCSPPPCLSYSTEDLLPNDQLVIDWHLETPQENVFLLLGPGIEDNTVRFKLFDTDELVLNASIVESYNETSGSFIWTVPWINTDTRLRILMQLHPDIELASSFKQGETFSIVAPPLNQPFIFEPTPQQYIFPGDILRISWQGFSANVDIFLVYASSSDLVPILSERNQPAQGAAEVALPTPFNVSVHALIIQNGNDDKEFSVVFPLFTPDIRFIINHPASKRVVQDITLVNITYFVDFSDNDVEVSITNASALNQIVLGSLPHTFSQTVASAKVMFRENHFLGNVILRLRIKGSDHLIAEDTVFVMPPCPPGTYYDDITIDCLPCVKGTFTNITNMDACMSHIPCANELIEVAPGTPTRSPLCIDERIPVHMSSLFPTSALMLAPPQLDVNATRTDTMQRMLVLTPRPTTVSMFAHVGPVFTTNHFSVDPPSPPDGVRENKSVHATLLGSVASTIIFVDDPVLDILCIPVNRWDVPVAGAECHVHVSVSDAAGWNTTSSCQTSGNANAPSCIVHIDLSDNIEFLFDTSHQVSVSVGPSPDMMQHWKMLQTANRVQVPESPMGDIIVTLPQRPLARRSTFQLIVNGFPDSRPINTWQIRITSILPGVRMVTVSRGMGWDVTVSDLPSYDIAVLGVRTVDDHAEPGRRLFEASISVDALAPERVSLNVSVVEAFDTAGQPVLSDAAPLITVSNYPNSMPLRTTSVHLKTYDENEVAFIQLIPNVDSSFMDASITVPTTIPVHTTRTASLSNLILNMAVLNSDLASVRHPLTVVAYDRSGKEVYVGSSDLMCTSEDENILQVTRDCSSVYFTGNETKGAASVHVYLHHSRLNLSSAVAFQVWFPETPVIALHAESLYRIRGSSMYQHTPYSITSQWSCDSQDESITLPSADITDYVWNQLGSQSSHSTDHVVITRQAITANMPGIYELCLSFNHTTTRTICATLNVIDTEVGVLGIHAFSIARVSFNLEPEGIDSNNDSSPSLCENLSTSTFSVCRHLRASYTSALTSDGQVAYVFVHATFEDGSTQLLDPTIHNISLYISESSPLVAGYLALEEGSGLFGFPYVQTFGGGPIPVNVTWLLSGTYPSPTRHPSTVFNVVSKLPEVVGVRLDGIRGSLLPLDDIATKISTNIPSEVAIRIYLQFADNTEIDFTFDQRMRAQTEGNITAQIGDEGLLLVAKEGATEGTARLIIYFTHTDASTAVNIAIIATAHLRANLYAHPQVPQSTCGQIKELRRLGVTHYWQEVRVHAELVLSTGVAHGIATDNPELKLHFPNFLQYSKVTNVVTPSNVALPENKGNVTIAVEFASLSTEILVEISDKSWSITHIAVNFPSTVSGIVGSTHQVRARITLSNGCVLSEAYLFPNNGPLHFPGIITFFTSSNVSGLTLNQTTGMATVLANSIEEETIIVQATSNHSSGTSSFVINLTPGPFDVDLGVRTGLPLSPQNPGSHLNIPVRIYFPSALPLTSLSLRVNFPDNVLEFQDISPGTDWPGGEFAGGLDGPGLIAFGGSTSSVLGEPELFVISLRVREDAASSVVNITGHVITLANEDGDLLSSNTPFVAGHVFLRILSSAEDSSRRREVSKAISHVHMPVSTSISKSMLSRQAERNRREECTSRPCLECIRERQLGDADGNCVFDIRDVTFLKRYLNTRLLDPNNPLVTGVQSFQLPHMDADSNGIVNTVDVDYLVRANFGIFLLLQDANISLPNFHSGLTVSIEETECSLIASVRLLAGGDGRMQVPATAERALVFLYIDSPNVTLCSEDKQTLVVTEGKLVNSTACGSSQRGLLVQAMHVPSSSTFRVVIATDIDSSDIIIGMSPLIITIDAAGRTSTRRSTALLTNTNAPFTIAGEQRVIFEQQQQLFELAVQDYGSFVWSIMALTSSECRIKLPCDDTSSEFVVSNATMTSNPTCAALTQCVQGVSFEIQEPTPYRDRACSVVTECSPIDEYEKATPTLFTDRVCKHATVCAKNQYEVVSLMPTADRACKNATVCTKNQFEEVALTPTADRVCHVVQECNEHAEMELSPPTATTDRACVGHPCNVSSICLPTGTCQLSEMGVYCDCPLGDECGPRQPPTENFCDPSPCNDGVCVSIETGPFCACPKSSPNCGPTTVSPGISSSGSNVDTSTVVIASVCSLLGLVLLVVLIILSRKIRLHRKKRNANSDSNFGAIEINGTARDPLHRQISLRTQEDVNTFVPIFLGRLDSFEETPFDGEKEDGIEDAEARRKRYASSSALRHSQSFENEYSDIHQMTQTTNKYHDAPSSRFQKNPTYAGDSTEHQYADMIPDSSERGSKRSIEHHYEAINTPNAQGNTYHIPLLLKQNSTENPYDLPKCEPTNHIFPTPSSEYDQPTYLNENGVDIMLYDELPGKSRQSSFRKSVKLADTSVLNADVSNNMQRRGSKVKKISDALLHDTDADVFYVPMNNETLAKFGAPQNAFRVIQAATNELYLAMQPSEHRNETRPSYFDPKPTPINSEYTDVHAQSINTDYFDPKPTPINSEYTDVHAQSNNTDYFDPKPTPVNPEYADSSFFLDSATIGSEAHLVYNNQPTQSFQYSEDAVARGTASQNEIERHHQFMAVSKKSLLNDPTYSSLIQ